NAQGACRLLVGEAGDVDGDEHVTEVVRERGDGGVELAGLECGLRLERLQVGDEVELVGKRAGTESAALGPFLVQERIAQRTQEVAEVVLVVEQARASEQARVGLLDEVLGILARAAERPSGPVKPVEVVSEPSGIERALHRIRPGTGGRERRPWQRHALARAGGGVMEPAIDAHTSVTRLTASPSDYTVRKVVRCRVCEAQHLITGKQLTSK